MKIRNGYVSNSSSSSFVVLNLDTIPKEIIDKIVHYNKACQQYLDELKRNNIPIDEENDFDCLFDDHEWNITINKEDNCIDMWTILDNFNMGKWLDVLGVKYRSTGDC